MKQTPVSAKVKASRQLAEAAQSSRAAGRKTCDAAQAVGQAADKLDAALLALAPLGATQRELRRQRDTLGRPWDRTLAVLRRDARSAEDEGATGLYVALFGAPAPVTRKTDTPADGAAAQPPVTTPTASSAPPEAVAATPALTPAGTA